MNIVDTENGLFCDEGPETIEHLYLRCRNSIKLWNDTISWVRSICGHHFIISYHEKYFGGPINNHVLNWIIINQISNMSFIRSAKTGNKMVITDVKKLNCNQSKGDTC